MCLNSLSFYAENKMKRFYSAEPLSIVSQKNKKNNKKKKKKKAHSILCVPENLTNSWLVLGFE